jgi:lipoprotein-anchoring transpeptidase ErfK/SrfK
MPFMMRLTMDGIAIHGSDVREGFGTHGCIGIPTDFASLLYAQVHRGDMVVILPVTAPPEIQG